MIETLVLTAALAGNGPLAEAPPAPIAVPEETAAPSEPKWTGSLNIGASFTDGNTETLAANAGFDAERRAAKDRYTCSAYWNYAEQKIDGQNQITTRKVGATGQYDYFASEKLYYLANVGADSDTLANLDLRYYAGGGAGYQFIENEKMKFNGELGLVYFAQEFTDNIDDSYVSARAAYNYFNQLTPTAVLEQSGEVFPSLEDTEDVYTKLDTRLKLTLTKSMFAQIQHVWDWDNTPAAGAYRSDHRVILGVGWSF